MNRMIAEKEGEGTGEAGPPPALDLSLSALYTAVPSFTPIPPWTPSSTDRRHPDPVLHHSQQAAYSKGIWGTQWASHMRG